MTGDLPTQPSLRRLREFGVRPNRELGQNFLIDSNILGVIERAAEVGLLEVPLLAAHCIWIDDADIRQLAAADATVVYNPVANMILAAGVCPVQDIRRAGIPVGLGTDGAASNDSQHMLETVKTAALLQRVARLDVAALMEEMYDESLAAAALLVGDGEPRANIEATIRGLFEAWSRHEHLFRAMLDARATSTAVREMWDADRTSFVPHVAAMITGERSSFFWSASNSPGGDILPSVKRRLIFDCAITAPRSARASPARCRLRRRERRRGG